MRTLIAMVLLGSATNGLMAIEPFQDVTDAVGLKGLSGDVAAWGDFNNDGGVDLYSGGQLWRNEAGKRFRRVENVPIAGAGIWGDFDNDGFLDLFFTTVYPGDRSVLYRNRGGWQFEDISAAAKVDVPTTYQAAWADFDGDGYLDLAAGGRLFRNPGGKGHWLRVRLIGDGKVNAAAIGAQVRLELGDQILTRGVEGATGQGNQNDLTLHFGLGSHAEPVSLEIHWPNGPKQKVETAIDRTLTVEFDPAVIDSAPSVE